jgi:drug efflux transport system ATP-binding protein
VTSSNAAIEVSELSKRFGSIRAVERLSFCVEAGEIFGLVGPDGAGKTTTLRVLAGVLQPDEGGARIAGCDVVRDPESAKRHLSYMPQRFGLYEELTVEENIRFYADLFAVPRADRELRAGRLLVAAGMNEFRARLAGKLSGGMQQKLGLVCALIHKPEVILLDEPTTGVDPVSRRDFWKILYGLASEGVAILTSTAYLDEAERCHRVALLHQGELMFCDTPAHLKARLGKGVVSVVSSEPRRLREALERAEGVSSLVLTGDGVHAVVDNPVKRIPEFQARLEAAGIPVEQIFPTTPTIEDLFVESVTRGSAPS